MFNAWLREQSESLGVEVNPTLRSVRRRDADVSRDSTDASATAHRPTAHRATATTGSPAP